MIAGTEMLALVRERLSRIPGPATLDGTDIPARQKVRAEQHFF
jgi:hypothetical protein